VGLVVGRAIRIDGRPGSSRGGSSCSSTGRRSLQVVGAGKEGPGTRTFLTLIVTPAGLGLSARTVAIEDGYRRCGE